MTSGLVKPSRIFRRALRPLLVALLVAASLAACAPRARSPQVAPTTPPATETPVPPATEPTDAEPAAPAEPPAEETIVLTDPVALETDRVAREAFHLMELTYLETGSYSANVLISDLNLPAGVRWMLEDLSETSYALRITSDGLPDIAWFVSPDGVAARQVEDNRIY